MSADQSAANPFDAAAYLSAADIADVQQSLERTRAVAKLLLSPTEAARALGIGRSKLYELLAEGVVPSITIGTCRRIVASDLDAYIESLRLMQTEVVKPAAVAD
ncbi:MAG TPA: helix-turn-helix domain-containing protein [Mycobacteriales bacterium]|nr:helix-turn-helix domain-containing protein [Mycobacteriales bacterium]